MVFHGKVNYQKMQGNFHKQLTHFFLMGQYYRAELMALGSILNLVSEPILKSFEEDMVSYFERNNNYAKYSRMGIVFHLLKWFIRHFREILNFFYDNKLGRNMAILATNLKVVHKKLQSSKSPIAISKKNYHSVINKFEFGYLLLKFVKVLEGEGYTDLESVIELDFTRNFQRIILRFSDVLTNLPFKLSDSCLQSSEFQQLNRFCQNNFNLSMYFSKNSRLKSKDLLLFSEKFFERSLGSAYFIKNFVNHECKKKFSKHKIQVLFGDKGVLAKEKRMLMLRSVHEYWRFYEDVKVKDHYVYFLSQKSFSEHAKVVGPCSR